MGFPAPACCINDGNYLVFQSLIGIYGFSGAMSRPKASSPTESVSIPNRDLWVFRREQTGCFNYVTLFQSLIGIYGFSGVNKRGALNMSLCFNP